MTDEPRSYPIALFAAGRIEADGVAVSRFGADFRSKRKGAGHYKIEFVTPCPEEFCLTATAVHVGDTPVFCQVIGESGLERKVFYVFIHSLTEVAAATVRACRFDYKDCAFHFTAISRFA